MKIKKLLNPCFTLKDHTVSTVADYFALPKADRETRVWFWPTAWYLKPYALPISSIESLMDKNATEGWSAFDREIKKLYPIQYFVRNWDSNPVYFWFYCKWRLFNEFVVYRIKCFFNSRNKHIQKQIPNTWKSEADIIKDVLVAIFMAFYLPNKCSNWRITEEDNKDEDDFLKETNKYWHGIALECDECYKWFAEDRPKIVKEDEEFWDQALKNKNPYSAEDRYQKITELENKITAGDDKYLVWIAKNRFLFD